MHVKTVTSEVEVREQFINSLREKKQINQNAQYLDRGAELYYAITAGPNTHVKEMFARYYPFLKENVLEKKKKKKVALISLGCGNVSPEREMLEKMHKDGYEFTYFGVDISVSALELAREEIKHIDIPKQLIYADFGNVRFKEEIRELTKDFDLRIFAFFGGTIGQLEPDYLADTMADIMDKDDYLWVDISVRQGLTPADDRKLYERFRDYIYIPEWTDFTFRPLHDLGIPRESGEFYIEMSRKEDLNALQFRTKFHVKEKVRITHRGQRITFLPGNEAVLYTVTIFDADGLVHFFEERDFTLDKSVFAERRGQFLFKYTGEDTK